MDNTKHAPGPWHVAEWEVRDSDSDGAVGAAGWQVLGADGYAINTCISEGDGEQEEANLHFIVRACNSHEQLVHAIQMVRDADNDAASDGLTRIPAAARAAIDAAIAKAAGSAA